VSAPVRRDRIIINGSSGQDVDFDVAAEKLKYSKAAR